MILSTSIHESLGGIIPYYRERLNTFDDR